MDLDQTLRSAFRAGTQYRIGATLSDWLRRARLQRSIRTGSFHESDFAYFTRFAHRRATFIDIGANFGQSIVSFKTAAPDSIIHSFEPSPYPFNFASRVASRYEDVHLSQNGVGASTCALTLYTPVYRWMRFHELASTRDRDLDELAAWLRDIGYTYLKPGRLTSDRAVIPIIPLDSLGFSPDAIKMDVEGAEVDVIKGGLETIKRGRPVLLIEGGAREEIRELLHPLGYRSYFYDLRTASLKPGAGDLNTFFLP